MSYEFSRTTKHKKPRYQFLHFGFNPANSCWLSEEWVTLPEAEFLANRDAHEAFMQQSAAERASRVQHHRDPATPLDQLTPNQRAAYEFLSGVNSFSVRGPDGTVHMASAEMAGNKMRPSSEKGFRDSGFVIFRHVKNGYTGEVTNQIEGLDIPADLVEPEGATPVDPWSFIVDQNKQRERDMYDGLRAMAQNPGGGGWARMAFNQLIKLEESIIRAEWNASRGAPDPYGSPDEDRAEWVRVRAELKASFPDFDALYAERKDSHNKCARANLDNSNGVLFSYFLPEFHEDGRHEPWGDRDVPWNAS
jgi:hypothetical protein